MNAPHLTTGQMMQRYGYKDADKFLRFVYKHGVPHIRLHAKKIVFPVAAVEAWELKRSVGC